MKKNILIAFLTLMSVFFLVYANLKASEAEKYAIQAQLNLELAKENEAKAKAEEQQAVEAAARTKIAERKISEFKERLGNCK